MDSVHRLGNSLLGLIQTRAELFVVELQEEKLRAISLLLWLALGLSLAVAGLLIAAGILALYLWQIAGYTGLLGLAAGILLAAALIFWGIRHRILRGPQPFAETLGEFRKDAASLRRPE
jgi:uncharacterized membrane protein YqjE